MKKNIFHPSSFIFHPLLLLFCGFLTACGLVELHSSKNGDLDGFWHLETVDTLATGNSADLREELRFWMFQGGIFQCQSPDFLNGQRLVSQFSHEDGQIILWKLLYDRREEGDPVVENVELLQPFGINQIEGSTFRVEELSGSKMTLSTETLRLSFKKH
ncbi:MAG: lipocalin-like domain-containing protein [Prevotella sp.]|nr:lipocalin-like domain-containing protein [Prevotella sp.]